jgi:hypothetical protein
MMPLGPGPFPVEYIFPFRESVTIVEVYVLNFLNLSTLENVHCTGI